MSEYKTVKLDWVISRLQQLKENLNGENPEVYIYANGQYKLCHIFVSSEGLILIDSYGETADNIKITFACA